MTRRKALDKLLWLAAGSPLLRAQEIPYIAERIPLLSDLVNVFEFEPVAKARLPKQNYDYIAGGVDDEWTLRRNREAFNWITLIPRMLVDVSNLDMSVEVFGARAEMPIFIAPTGAMALAHPEAELAMAKAAGAMKTIMCVSSNSSVPIEKIAETANGTLWFQLYAVTDLDFTRERVERAVAAGCKAVAFTADAPYNSHRERLLRNRVLAQVPPGRGAPIGAPVIERRRRHPPSGAAPEPPGQYRLERRLTAELTWKFLEDLNRWANVPVLVKGILAAEDAKRAMDHGAAGIIVSNHGGRYLGAAPSTIEVLPEIIDAVGGKVPVLIDSGVRRGTDIIKALAIGAKAVMVGRPTLWGLAAYGQEGAIRVLQLLQSELALAMGLAGRPNLAAIDRSLVRLDPPL